MRSLETFLVNPFNCGEFGLDRLIGFTTDSLQRMVANNPGALFNTRITATTAKLQVLDSCLTDDQTKLGLRKGKKLVKDSFRKNLPKQLEKIWAVVVAEYGSDSAEVLTCFPQGRAVYTSCTDDHVENHLQTLINGLTPLVPVLGPEVSSNAGGLLSSWLVVYNASESSSGAKTMTEAGKKAAREALQLELFLNLLEIAKAFPGQPEKLSLYMQQTLLVNNPAEEPEPVTP